MHNNAPVSIFSIKTIKKWRTRDENFSNLWRNSCSMVVHVQWACMLIWTISNERTHRLKSMDQDQMKHIIWIAMNENWKTMFQTNDFKREEIEKSLKWNFKNEKKLEWKHWLWVAHSSIRIIVNEQFFLMVFISIRYGVVIVCYQTKLLSNRLWACGGQKST